MSDEPKVGRGEGMLPPEMIIKRTPVFYHKEDIERVLMDKLPGHIADFSRGSQWPGCRIIKFGHFGTITGLPADVRDYILTRTPDWANLTPEDNMNNFFALFANYYVASWNADNTGIYCMYSSILDEEDATDMNEVSAEIRKGMNEKRAKRAAAMKEAQDTAKAEMDEIIALGRIAKANPDAVAREAALMREITELKLENKRMSRKKGSR